MSYFVRKISKSKWKCDTDEAVIKADALTSCLRTSGNTLSFWRIDSMEQLEEAKLAIAASNSNLDTFDIVIFTDAEMTEFGAPILESKGETACIDLIDTHRDLAELNSDHLIKLSHAVLKKVQRDEVQRITFSKLKSLMATAAANERLNLDKISDAVKSKIGLHVELRPKCTCGASSN